MSMKEAVIRVDFEAKQLIDTMADGEYTIKIHGYLTVYKIEKGQIFGQEEKSGKRVWFPTFVAPLRIQQLTKV